MKAFIYQVVIIGREPSISKMITVCVYSDHIDHSVHPFRDFINNCYPDEKYEYKIPMIHEIPGDVKLSDDAKRYKLLSSFNLVEPHLHYFDLISKH
jgi:hypothetical protein